MADSILGDIRQRLPGHWGYSTAWEGCTVKYQCKCTATTPSRLTINIATMKGAMRLSVAFVLCILFFHVCSSTPSCKCRECPAHDPKCKRMGGCFRVDIDVNGQSVLGFRGSCHNDSSTDRFLKDLLRRVPTRYLPEEITTIRSVPLFDSSLIIAVTYCRPTNVPLNSDKCVDGYRKESYGGIRRSDDSCDSLPTNRAIRFAWKDDGELITSDLCARARDGIRCTKNLSKSTFHESKGKQPQSLTLCDWYANRSEVIRNANQNDTASEPTALPYTHEVTYGALGAVLFAMCLGTGIGIYEFIRWRRQRRRRKAGLGFGDQVVSGKTSQTTSKSSSGSRDIHSTMSKDSLMKSRSSDVAYTSMM